MVPGVCRPVCRARRAPLRGAFVDLEGGPSSWPSIRYSLTEFNEHDSGFVDVSSRTSVSAWSKLPCSEDHARAPWTSVLGHLPPARSCPPGTITAQVIPGLAPPRRRRALGGGVARRGADHGPLWRPFANLAAETAQVIPRSLKRTPSGFPAPRASARTVRADHLREHRGPASSGVEPSCRPDQLPRAGLERKAIEVALDQRARACPDTPPPSDPGQRHGRCIS